ncbi:MULTISPECIES: glycosyltransferase [unclassified Caballeronia]|uniref:glycosyltransferase n=1 Tax=unclassified Caballeronia TaxID=2646786 RepID=UPI0020291727|nr:MULTISPECIES: glycosyltransferase [unclassified Caballeronia]
MNTISALELELETRAYLGHRLHEFLAADSGKPDGANIGENGLHLTIAMCIDGDSAPALALCQSIAQHLPYFAGKVLILVNGEDAAALDKLQQFRSESSLKSRVEFTGAKMNRAACRNRMASIAQTGWIMFVERGVSFTRDLMRDAQRDIASLGCHFLAMSAADKTTENGRTGIGYLVPRIAPGRLEIAREMLLSTRPHMHGGGFLVTLLSGPAVFVRIASLQALGGYDEALSEGLDETDLSLRLFEDGRKVGMSDAPGLTLTRTPAPAHSADADSNVLRAASIHFDCKHHLRAPWVEPASAQAAPQAAVVAPPAVTTDATPRPRIALMVDTGTWALANIARQIMRYTSDEFEFDLITLKDIGNPVLVLEMTRAHDLVHMFWREPLHHLDKDWGLPYVERLCGGWEPFVERLVAPRPITFTVFDHLFLSQEETLARAPMYHLASGYTVSSDILKRIYENIPHYPKPQGETPDGVDLTRFSPSNLARFSGASTRDLRIGWSGNSAWGSAGAGGERLDPKGFHTILKPALEILRAKGLQVSEHFADRQVRHIPHSQMPAYYNSLDVLVCCSEAEGTPNPVLEAMASGVPVISTNVGIVSEALGPLQREFILKERSAVCLAEAIEKLIVDRYRLQQLSAENVNSIKNWDWSVRTQAYRKFFRETLLRFKAQR